MGQCEEKQKWRCKECKVGMKLRDDGVNERKVGGAELAWIGKCRMAE